MVNLGLDYGTLRVLAYSGDSELGFASGVDKFKFLKYISARNDD